MKKIVYIILLLLITGFYGQAQKEANWWHFGTSNSAGGVGNSLDFNNTLTVNDDNGTPTPGMPTAGTGKITSTEGCFTLSDKDGNLMMYSDGMKVWNKNSIVMPNGSGLMGGSSSSQSGIVVPYPGEPDKYYVITVAENRGTNGIRYSVVDMALQGGLGDVVSGEKNLSLRPVATDENVAAVKKTGSDNYWIVHRDMAQSIICTFYVWELTPTGFVGPVTYSMTTTNQGGSSFFTNVLKFSPDGTKLISPLSGDRLISGEFNPATGEISGLQCRVIGLASLVYYAEFSLSGNQLFIGAYSPIKLGHLTWDALRNTSAPATNNLNLGGYASISSMQMNTDGRIYGIETGTKNLYVIMNPEEGASADIRKFSDYLSVPAAIGLPTFAANFMIIEANDCCVNTSQDYSVSLFSGTTAYIVWDFGDGTVVTNNISGTGDQIQSHTYTHPGTYTITVKSLDASNSLLKQESIDVTVNPCMIPVNPNVHLFK